MRPASLFAVPWLLLFAGCDGTEQGDSHFESGLAHLDEGRLEHARIELLNAERARPGDPEVSRELGAIHLRQGAYFAAARRLDAYVRSFPKDTETRFRLATALAGLGMLGDARREAIAVAAGDPHHSEALLLAIGCSTNEEEIVEIESMLPDVVKEADRAEPIRLAKASILFRRGQAGPALDLVDRCLDANPGAPKALGLKAAILESLGRTTEAEAAIAGAAEHSDPRSTERVNHVRFLMRHGKSEDALAILRQLVADVPDFVPYLRHLAEAAYSSGDLDGARRWIAKMNALSPDDAELRLLEARIAEAAGEIDAAIDILRSVNAVHPSHPVPYFELSRIHLARGEAEQGLENAAPLLRMAPGHPGALMVAGELHLRANRNHEAAELLARLCRADPQNNRARLLLAEALRRTGRTTDAITTLDAPMSDPGSALRRHVLRGSCLSALGRSQAARSEFAAARAIDPDDPELFHQAATLELNGNRLDELDHLVTARIERNPEDADAVYFRGMAAYRRGAFDIAEEDARFSLGKRPDNLPAHQLLIASLMARGGSAEALTSVEAALDSIPGDPALEIQRGALHQQLGRNDDAIRCYRKIVGSHPDNGLATNNLAMMLLDVRGSEKEALELAYRAKELMPSEPAVLDTLGWALFLNGDYGLALTHLEEASAALPSDADCQFRLGRASFVMGRESAALEAFRKVVAMTPPTSNTPQASDFIGLLESTPTDQPDRLRTRLESDPLDAPAGYRLAELLCQNDNAAAREVLEGMLKANSDLFAARKRLIVLRFADGIEPETTWKMAVAANNKRSDDPELASIVGRLAHRRGDSRYSMSVLQGIADSRQLTAEEAYCLGMSLADAGDPGRARSWLATAIDLGLSGADAENAQAALADATAN